MSDTLIAPAETDRSLAEDESHITCCMDDNTALCGLDVTLHPWREFLTPSCVVCEDLDGGNWCPLRKGRCP